MTETQVSLANAKGHFFDSHSQITQRIMKLVLRIRDSNTFTPLYLLSLLLIKCRLHSPNSKNSTRKTGAGSCGKLWIYLVFLPKQKGKRTLPDSTREKQPTEDSDWFIWSHMPISEPTSVQCGQRDVHHVQYDWPRLVVSSLWSESHSLLPKGREIVTGKIITKPTTQCYFSETERRIS